MIARLIATIALLVAVNPAAAQDTEIGSRLRPRADTQMRSADPQISAAHRWARCAVMKRSGTARGMLNATSETDYARFDRELSREVSCSSLVGSVMQQSGQMIAMSRDVYRGSIAEALMRNAGKQAELPALPLERIYTSPFAEISGRNIVVEEMGVCLAATQPAGVSAVLATEPASPQEIAAIRAIAPSFGPCLAATAKLTANRQSLRAAMAEAYYHRLNAPAAVAAVERK